MINYFKYILVSAKIFLRPVALYKLYFCLLSIFLSFKYP